VADHGAAALLLHDGAVARLLDNRTPATFLDALATPALDLVDGAAPAAELLAARARARCRRWSGASRRSGLRRQLLWNADASRRRRPGRARLHTGWRLRGYLRRRRRLSLLHRRRRTSTVALAFSTTATPIRVVFGWPGGRRGGCRRLSLLHRRRSWWRRRRLRLLSGRRRAGNGTVIAAITTSATAAAIFLVALSGGRPGRRSRRLSLLYPRRRRWLTLRGSSVGSATLFTSTPSAILFRRSRGRSRYCRRLGLLLGWWRTARATAAVTTLFAALARCPLIRARSRVWGLYNLDAFALLDLLRRQAGKCHSVEGGE
jgi:hypothetical protein